MMDLVCIWYMIDIGPKFYTVPSPPPIHDFKVKVMAFMLKFYIKVFRTSLFPNPMMGFGSCLVQ